MPHVPPAHNIAAFNCPHCRAFAVQSWGQLQRGPNPHSGFRVAECAYCKKPTIWEGEEIIFPITLISPDPNPDLPDDIKRDYEEARQVLASSPRGSAALLRLAIQKLCVHLEEKGENINEDIGALVAKGLPTMVQQALDLVRVIGNNAVHPGQIDLNDDKKVADKLFPLVNVIAEVMISQPNQIKTLYESVLPESQREAIEQRDDT
ncbi:MAG: DUF4145 domain-containing protein [Bacteroidetes bacterium]|nr:DUF4145 domain-containing protein [Bacteroidota bacterium]